MKDISTAKNQICKRICFVETLIIIGAVHHLNTEMCVLTLFPENNCRKYLHLLHDSKSVVKRNKILTLFWDTFCE